MFPIIFYLILQSFHMIRSQNPIVETNVGSIRGLAATDGDYDMYMGIPYATVDRNNPFGESLLQPTFTEVFNAYDDTAICPQIEEFNATVTGTLDCLHLNIYVPNSASSTNSLAVMVYIYGGGFRIGFAGRFLYGPKYLVRHDVILVTVNYRVGPYGFMCLGTPEVPGNAGLKDQLKALRWINANIGSFGGDVNRITLFGNSAGGMAIDLHMISPNEKLFNAGIIQSGTAYSLGIQRGSSSSAFQLAEQLGRTTSDLDEALSFLATVDPLVLIAASNAAGIAFSPCIENEFPGVEMLTSDYPVNLDIPKAEGTTFMMGYNNKEALYIANMNEAAFESSNHFSAIATIFEFEPNLYAEVEYLVRRFYMGDEDLNLNLLNEVVDFTSDIRFNYPTDRRIKSYLDNGVEKIYYYMFSHDGERNFVKYKGNITVEGAAHADEYAYLFDMEFIPFEITPEDQIVLDRMTAMWTNFAKYGDPTPDTTELLPVKWEPITKDSVYHYMDIDLELTAGRRPFHHRMAFWDLFFQTYSEYQRGVRNENAASSVILSPVLYLTITLLGMFSC